MLNLTGIALAPIDYNGKLGHYNTLSVSNNRHVRSRYGQPFHFS